MTKRKSAAEKAATKNARAAETVKAKTTTKRSLAATRVSKDEQPPAPVERTVVAADRPLGRAVIPLAKAAVGYDYLDVEPLGLVVGQKVNTKPIPDRNDLMGVSIGGDVIPAFVNPGDGATIIVTSAN